MSGYARWAQRRKGRPFITAPNSSESSSDNTKPTWIDWLPSFDWGVTIETAELLSLIQSESRAFAESKTSAEAAERLPSSGKSVSVR